MLRMTSTMVERLNNVLKTAKYNLVIFVCSEIILGRGYQTINNNVLQGVSDSLIMHNMMQLIMINLHVKIMLDAIYL